MNYRLKTLLIAGTLTLLTTSSIADSKHFTKAARSAKSSYDFRASTMNIYKWYLSPMGAMVKGKVKFNKDAFSAYADGLLLASKLDLIEGFPEDSGAMEVEDSRAKDEIWEDPKGFANGFKRFQEEAQKLADVAKKGDEKAIKSQFKNTSKICGGCHKKFRTKK